MIDFQFMTPFSPFSLIETELGLVSFFHQKVVSHFTKTSKRINQKNPKKKKTINAPKTSTRIINPNPTRGDKDQMHHKKKISILPFLKQFIKNVFNSPITKKKGLGQLHNRTFINSLKFGQKVVILFKDFIYLDDLILETQYYIFNKIHKD